MVVSCSSEPLQAVETWRGDAVKVDQTYRGQEAVDGMAGPHHGVMSSVSDAAFFDLSRLSTARLPVLDRLPECDNESDPARTPQSLR